MKNYDLNEKIVFSDEKPINKKNHKRATNRL